MIVRPYFFRASLREWGIPLGPHMVKIPYSLFNFSLAEFPYLFGDRQALPKTLEKTEMVLRFPLGFA